MATYPYALQSPGPIEKQGYPGMAFNACRGVVCHSMVGSYRAAWGELGNLNRRASWHFSVKQNGDVIQHYDSKLVTWHCGTKRYNGIYIGIEHEGGLNPHNEPLTKVQREASVDLVRWLSIEHGFPMSRESGLKEHNEVAPSSDPTACPSGRIPWEYYTEEDTVNPLVWNPDFGRLYLLTTDAPKWLLDPGEIAILKKVYGEPKVALSWLELKVLGAK